MIDSPVSWARVSPSPPPSEPGAGASNQLAAGAGEAAACRWRRGVMQGAPAPRPLGEEARELEWEVEEQGEESGAWPRRRGAWRRRWGWTAGRGTGGRWEEPVPAARGGGGRPAAAAAGGGAGSTSRRPWWRRGGGSE